MIMSLTRRIRIDDDYLVNPGSGGQDKIKEKQSVGQMTDSAS